MRTLRPTSLTKIRPSPGSPVWAAWWMAAMTIRFERVVANNLYFDMFGSASDVTIG